MSRNPIHANPVSIEKKAKIFRPGTKKDADDYLKAYIRAFLAENRISTNVTNKIFLRRLLVSFVYSLILFLDIVHLCLYHETFFLNFLIFAAPTIAYVIIVRRMSMFGYLVKEIKKRPMDPIDNILASQVSGTKNGLFSLIAVFALPVIVLIASGILFASPRYIYERNDSGYSLRYYTLGLSDENTVIVPETHKGLPVTEVRGKTFTNLDIISVQLPSRLTEIRGETFKDCENLRSVNIPQGVKRIGGHAFDGCSSLREVVLPPLLESIGSSAFRGCSSLQEIDFPRSVREIGQSAFRGCSSLVEVYVPQGVKTIGPSAFRECGRLKTIRIPSSASVGEKAFKDTYGEIEYY